MVNPQISICVPAHKAMKNHDFFLERLKKSVEQQTFKDYELIVTYDGKMAENTNSAIKQAKGEIVKVLYMDDFFAHPDALQRIVEAFKGGWLVTGNSHTHGEDRVNDHLPTWNDNIKNGANTIGSPSVLAFENKDPLLFDENLSWLLDCELYDRMYKRYGPPTFLNDINVVLGIGDHQMTHILTDEEKLKEHEYIKTI